MILDRDDHREQILELLTMPGLVLSADPKRTLEQQAERYLDLLRTVRDATVAEPEAAG